MLPKAAPGFLDESSSEDEEPEVCEDAMETTIEEVVEVQHWEQPSADGDVSMVQVV
jgi:hypothetical protein